MASLQDGAWRLGTSVFERITCERQIHVELHSEKASRTFGPFHELTIGDGVIRGEGLLARYRPFDEVWSFDEDLEAETVVVSDGLPLAA